MNARTLSDITVETWIQGDLSPIENLIGSVVLCEVFQVNCPGCFLYALPKAVQLHEQYHDKGLTIIGLATAFEDYDKNNLENLQRLVTSGEVIGATLSALTHQDLLADGKLSWRFPFPVGMDRIVPETEPVTREKILHTAKEALPNFEELAADKKETVLNQVRNYLKQKTMKAETFERFALRGTPSAILFDRKGHLRDISFGQMEHQQSQIERILEQSDSHDDI